MHKALVAENGNPLTSESTKENLSCYSIQNYC